jgi:hypothetical protein
MSRKSGFSNRFSFECPGVQRQLPHHAESFDWCCIVKVGLFSLIRKVPLTNFQNSLRHKVILSQARLDVVNSDGFEARIGCHSPGRTVRPPVAAFRCTAQSETWNTLASGFPEASS